MRKPPLSFCYFRRILTNKSDEYPSYIPQRTKKSCLLGRIPAITKREGIRERIVRLRKG